MQRGGETVQKRIFVEDTGKQRKHIEEFEKFAFPYEESPEVSIIIPVYNEEKTIENILEILENTDFCGLEKKFL